VPELSSVFLAAVSVLGVVVTMPLESTNTTSTWNPGEGSFLYKKHKPEKINNIVQ